MRRCECGKLCRLGNQQLSSEQEKVQRLSSDKRHSVVGSTKVDDDIV